MEKIYSTNDTIKFGLQLIKQFEEKKTKLKDVMYEEIQRSIRQIEKEYGKKIANIDEIIDDYKDQLKNII